MHHIEQTEKQNKKKNVKLKSFVHETKYLNKLKIML